MKKLLLIILFVLCANGAQASTYYVNKSGSDSNSCATAESATDSNAKLTVQAGVNCIAGNDGDILIIGNGTYIENVTVSSTRNGASWSVPTTIRAENNRLAIIQSAGNPITFGSSSNPSSFIISDGIIYDGNHVASRTILISNIGSDLRFQDGTIRHGRDHGFDGSGFPARLEVLNNIIHHNGKKSDGTPTCQVGEPDDPGLCHGAYIDGPNHLIEGNLFYGNSGRGLQMYPGPTNATVRNNIAHSNRDGLLINGGSGHRVYNNIAYNNTVDGLVFPNNSSSTIVGNTSYDNNGVGINSSGNTKIFRNNISSGNGTNLTITGTGHTISNNMCSGTATNCAIVEAAATTFVAAGSANFTLKVGSAAINAGATLGSPYNVDALGVARPQGASYDLGALELTTAGATTFDLNVASVNPVSGVTVTVSPADNGALTDGSTAFTRNYDDTTAVTLVAPATAGANDFSAWANCDSVGGAGNRTCTVTMTTDRTVTVTYVTPNDPVILKPPTNLKIGSGVIWKVGTK